MIDFLIENVSRPNLCQQVIETGVLSKVVSDENDDIVAAYGWKFQKFQEEEKMA